MTERSFSAEAPTKIILSGEHSVVHGYPALVLAVEPKVKSNVRPVEEGIAVLSSRLGQAKFDTRSGKLEGDKRLVPAVEVLRHVRDVCGSDSGLEAETSSEAPLASGMGSSASAFVSMALAAFRALGVNPTRDQLVDAAMVGEKIVHSRPSGVDVEIAVSGGAIRYVKGQGSSSVKMRADIPLLVVNTETERRTGDMVERFRSRLESGGDEMKRSLETIGALTDQIERALLEGDMALVGRLMTANHVFLSSFGVSTPLLDRIVAECVMAGALGAKLTGAGGGGSAIALVGPEAIEGVRLRMNEIGLKSFRAKPCAEGARAW